MTRLRRALPRIALTWLLCHAATLTGATAVLWSGADGLLECICTHGDHTYCPMHHKLAPGSKVCLMQSANDTGSAVLGSLFGVLRLVATPAQSVALQAERGAGVIEGTTPSLRPAPPDPPPPRA
jgi:hypothetical protein